MLTWTNLEKSIMLNEKVKLQIDLYLLNTTDVKFTTKNNIYTHTYAYV